MGASQKIALPQDLKLLEETGREIVRKCGCLPLPISVVGGILQQEKTSTEWKKVCKNIDLYLQRGKGVEKDQRVAQIGVELQCAPLQLEAMFFILRMFPEDTEIYTEQLYFIWMAEGMISSQDRGRGETLRDVAERYLFELASKEEEFLEVVDMQMRGQDERSMRRTSRLAVHLDEIEGDYIRGNQNLRSLISPEMQQGRRDWSNFGVRWMSYQNPCASYHACSRWIYETIIGGGKLKLDGLNELETLVGFDSLTDDASHLLKLPKLQRTNGNTGEASYVAVSSLVGLFICGQRDGLWGDWLSSAKGESGGW
ncbi:putative disease resistance protein [Sesamum angolense]|uniref:Disease resistance protein n=1 Tax=Sesamum angolense TaxID=2727404 RepID=A0AAE1X7P2_9LAMI|nr:putative disease resistance protein [Sesamum angolense]